MLAKSTSALMAAIEVYNKPNMAFREENFAILAINAWELLLKARLLQVSKNRLSSILLYERRRLSDGTFSKKRYRKTNRSGNHASIGLFQALDILAAEYSDSVPAVVRLNLEALCEVRDNAIHFLNDDETLIQKVYELGTATVKNYLHLLRAWFGTSLDGYQMHLMPIGFVGTRRHAVGVVLNTEERTWLKYVEMMEHDVDDDVSNDTNLTLDVDIRLRRSSESKLEVRISDAPDALEVQLSEEDVRDRYPWDYSILTARLTQRYKDFKANKKYHDLRKPLESDHSLCVVRYLDPGNPRSATKRFFSPNIVRKFDPYYTRSD